MFVCVSVARKGREREKDRVEVMWIFVKRMSAIIIKRDEERWLDEVMAGRAVADQ